MLPTLRLFFVGFFLLIISDAPAVATSIHEICTIAVRYAKNPAQVGEIAPMSRKTGFELARFVGTDDEARPHRYLEAGGGCGAVSVCIANKLRTQDHLDVIEIDPKMCEILQERLQSFTNVSVHCCSILDWNPEYKYDGIVCTLPFNSLGVDFARATIQHFIELSGPNCTLSYVEYPIINNVLQYFYGPQRKDMFRKVQKYMQTVREDRLVKQSFIFMNVPSTEVYHLALA